MENYNNKSIPFVKNNSYLDYAAELFKRNIGKIVTLHMSFPNDKEEKTFKGIIELIGNDFIIISEPSTGKWYLILIPYLNYAEFEESIDK